MDEKFVSVTASEATVAPRFSFSRLCISILMMGTACGLFFYAVSVVERTGGGMYPTICLLTAVFLVAAAIGLLFQKARAASLYLLRWVLEIFIP